MPSSSAIVTSAAALEALAAELSAAAAIALDTEFMRERTYRAELCLVQVATAGTACCVDPLALDSLAPLAAPLASPTTLKVLHAARQDLEVLAPVAGRFAAIFDTQVAAALAGFAAQIGYGELVAKLLGVTLAKAHTRADWAKRPLSAEQIDYALDDVRYLLPLRAALLERLDQLGRLDWLAQELAPLAQSAGNGVDPDKAWLRLKGLQGLDAGRLALAAALAAWRERRAIDRNRPRGWILDDVALREIILRVPRSKNELAAIPEMQEGVVRNSGDELLAMVEAAGIPQPAPPLPRRERPDPALALLVKKLAGVNQDVAAALGLSPEVLATRRDLEQLARGEVPESLANGWRRDVIGAPLRAAL